MSALPDGFLSLVLHAHLPFVRHEEHEHFFEETWLFEAIAETYLPLLDVLERLERDGVAYRIAISLSPTLLAMFDDPLLRSRTARWLDDRIQLARKECDRTRLLPSFRSLAARARETLESTRDRYHERYGGDLSRAFGALVETGHVELFTTGATHGYLPLMLGRRSAWRAQVGVAVDEFRRRFGAGPAGFWLPECGFVPGVDEILAEHGIRWFVVDTHGLLLATPRPRFGSAAPVRTPTGVVAFARDPESSRQVWSSVEGYPGDPSYRDFHRDIGWDLPWDYLEPHLPFGGFRAPTGFKYHRVTGPIERKEPYDPSVASERVALHAEHFVRSRVEAVRRLSSEMGRSPVVVAPYDAELFGHWWHEGPAFLDLVIRRLAATAERGGLTLATPTDVLDLGDRGITPPIQASMPAASSWGHRGYHEYWLDSSNEWIYRDLHAAVERMEGLASSPTPTKRGSRRRRALDQAARELLLAQSSDWPFVLRAGTFPEYARRRVREHLDAFFEIEGAVRSGRLEDREFLGRLAFLESRDPVFPAVNHRVFRPEPIGRALTDAPDPATSRPSVQAQGGRIHD